MDNLLWVVDRLLEAFEDPRDTASLATVILALQLSLDNLHAKGVTKQNFVNKPTALQELWTDDIDSAFRILLDGLGETDEAHQNSGHFDPHEDSDSVELPQEGEFEMPQDPI
jgi:hypothetical protein